MATVPYVPSRATESAREEPASSAFFALACIGLGFLVIESTSHFKTPLAFGAMALLALMSMVLFGIVVAIERITCPWYGRDH